MLNFSKLKQALKVSHISLTVCFTNYHINLRLLLEVDPLSCSFISANMISFYFKTIQILMLVVAILSTFDNLFRIIENE